MAFFWISWFFKGCREEGERPLGGNQCPSGGEPGSFFLGPKMVILGFYYYFLMIIQGSSGIVFGNKFVHFEHN